MHSLGNIQDLPVNDDPTILLGIVLGHLFHRVLSLALLVGFTLFLGLGRRQLFRLDLRSGAIALSRGRRFGGDCLPGNVRRDLLLLTTAGTGPREFEIDILGLRVDADLGLEQLLRDARYRSARRALVGELSEKVRASRVTGNASKYDTAAIISAVALDYRSSSDPLLY